MVLALIILIAMAFGFLVSPLVAGIVFVVGAVAWVLLAVMSGAKGESPSGGGPEAHTAARMRAEGRDASHR
ncbi:MAG TPA: hypothetical protein VMF55_13215 [Solirubrobacterales bacterium]|nr:hypothetical protein [Solirubrobacterales bacterium]